MTTADSYAVSQGQTALSDAQGYLSALQADEKTIRSDEQTILNDNQSIVAAEEALATAKRTAATTATKDAESVAAAQLSLKTTVNSIAQKQAPPTAAALASAKGSLVQAKASLENARLALADTTLRAPIAGVVSAVSGAVGTQTSGGGSSVVSASSSGSSGSGSSSGGFVTLTQVTGMQVLASFSETDAGKLRVGQPANVTVDAVLDKQLAAHVLAIASNATSSSNVVTYDVTFALDRTDSRLKPGMTANISVVTGEADNVVHVPTAAVRGNGRNSTVTVLRNGVQQSVPVVVGLQGDSSTAILSGLKAGDTVVLPSASVSLGTGTSNTPTTGGGRARFGGGGVFGGGLGG